MVKKATIALAGASIAFMAAWSAVSAQTATPTPTTSPSPTVSPSPTTSPTVPSGAPSTGRG